MRLGIDIRIDANCDRGGLADLGRDFAQRNKLGLALDVETENALLQRVGHFGTRLADAGENDLRRRNASSPRTAKFALRNDVHPGAEARHRRQHGRIGIGFDGKADERVLAGEGSPEEVVAARGLEVVSDDGALSAAVDRAIEANPDVADKIRDGKVAAAGALIGAVMKEMRGQADAARVRELILEKLGQ